MIIGLLYRHPYTDPYPAMLLDARPTIYAVSDRNPIDSVRHVVGYRHSDILGPVPETVYDALGEPIHAIIDELMHEGWQGLDLAIDILGVPLPIDTLALSATLARRALVAGEDSTVVASECCIDLESHYPDTVYLRIGLAIECTGPALGMCRVSGELAQHVVDVEAWTWRAYHKGVAHVEDHEHYLVSSRWVGGCGTHTRVYIRSDGALVLSHDTVDYLGVHVIKFDAPIWRLLGFETLEEALDYAGRNAEKAANMR